MKTFIYLAALLAFAQSSPTLLNREAQPGSKGDPSCPDKGNNPSPGGNPPPHQGGGPPPPNNGGPPPPNNGGPPPPNNGGPPPPNGGGPPPPSKTPVPYCSSIDWLITANHAQSQASVFCSSFLGVTTVVSTVTASTTVTGALSTATVTNTLNVTPTVTSTVTNLVTSQVTTTSFYTSTCTPAGGAATTTALHKRNGSHGYPDKWCWSWSWPYPTTQYQPTAISSACSCLVTTPTSTATVTSTVSKAGPTNTVTTSTTAYPTTITSTATVTSTTTSTSVITSTEIEPASPTGMYETQDGTTTFEEYSGIDFFSGDLQPYSPCSCDSDGSGGSCTIGGVNYGLCTGFDSCQNICADINEHNGNLTCLAVTYQGTEASGECYPKSSLNGCGVYADGRRSGLIQFQGYQYAP